MESFLSLDNKVAIITGGSAGIGRCCAERFASAGAKVVIADLADGQELARSLGGLYVKTDVSDENSVKALFGKVKEQYGNFDILVNNAGVAPDLTELAEAKQQDFDLAYRVNVLGVVWGLKHGPGFMNDHGAIVNTASMAGRMGVWGMSSYGSSKYSVVGLTQTSALELGARGIRVNAICPASVNTQMAAEGDISQLEVEKKLIPLGRICEPEEAAALIHFLVADDCKFINGQAINLCGGMSAGLGPAVWQALAGQLGDKQEQ